MANTAFDTEVQAQLNSALENEIPNMQQLSTQAQNFASDIVMIVKYAQAGRNLQTNVGNWAENFARIRDVFNNIVQDLGAANVVNVGTHDDSAQVTSLPSQYTAATPATPGTPMLG